ncbi:MAG TPA: LytTR family DNA-binding domain-containing protein [Chitinophagaceae bacterium]|nr:LytTR family DNA-binding domain-containing protein [Chitinophagaceae bacterium]
MSDKAHTYNTIIVDDNEIDRLTLQVQVRKYPLLNLVGVYDSAEKALVEIEEKGVQVLLLDIDMPGLSGLDLRKQLGNEQVCIFITSFPDYAVEGFELAALDFLVKPLDKSRFALTMERLSDYLDIRRKAELFECSLGADAVFIKDGHHQVKIQLHDILYLEALKDYTRIVTRQKRYCVLSILGNLLQEEAFKTFIRIHRSYAVQKNFIDRITAQQVVINDITLPIGRSYKSSLEELVAKGG